jgi:4-carboxymuconolactone decarboxylase
MMSESDSEQSTIRALSAAERAIVRLAAAIAGGSEAWVREALEAAHRLASPLHIEETILQSYLFAGFPRALNAARQWRALTGQPAPQEDMDSHHSQAEDWRARGEKTCEVVYGAAYRKLRKNIRALHPALDEWMLVDGYGKVLSRPGMPLELRELCVVAACAVAGQQRQLHSHLRGALNAGSSPARVRETLNSLDDLLSAESLVSYQLLFRRVAAE